MCIIEPFYFCFFGFFFVLFFCILKHSIDSHEWSFGIRQKWFHNAEGQLVRFDTQEGMFLFPEFIFSKSHTTALIGLACLRSLQQQLMGRGIFFVLHRGVGGWGEGSTPRDGSLQTLGWYYGSHQKSWTTENFVFSATDDKAHDSF